MPWFPGKPLCSRGDCRRFHSHHQGIRVDLLESLPYARDCAAGADAGHKGVHNSTGVPQYLSGSGVPVHLGVDRVVKLVQHQVGGVLADQGLCGADCAGHGFCGGRKAEVGAEARQAAVFRSDGAFSGITIIRE